MSVPALIPAKGASELVMLFQDSKQADIQLILLCVLILTNSDYYKIYGTLFKTQN